MSLTAADIMTTNVKTARPDASVAEVARVLSDNDISAVPVCDSQGQVLGMLSEGDLLRPLGKESAGKRAWWLSLLSEGADLAPSFLECISVENQRAGNLMVAPAITASPDFTISELADLLVRHHIKRLPILQHGRLIGIVSRADLVRALARTPDTVAEALQIRFGTALDLSPQSRDRVVPLRGPVIDVAFKPGALPRIGESPRIESDRPGSLVADV